MDHKASLYLKSSREKENRQSEKDMMPGAGDRQQKNG